MVKNLVIVESPAKAKTIEKFLGADYNVVSCYGHISDLPKKDLGINIDTFTPNYIIPEEKKPIIKKIKSKINKTTTVWLASDEDREGEAIAWHLYRELSLDKKNTKRIVFNEITKNAILNAISKPRDINEKLVNAQQARRVLDRIVGYELSPILWTKVKGGVSAGRVQSVAVRIIAEREKEIKYFKPNSYFNIQSQFLTKDNKKIKAKLNVDFDSEKETIAFLEKNKSTQYQIDKKEIRLVPKKPSAPFTTSTLQQEASLKLHFPVSKTMQLAQRLYEAGLITYMRTDSTNLSNYFQTDCIKKIKESYGDKYANARSYTKKSKGAQEAHEAIRPTDINVQNPQLENDQKRLYQIIYKRSIASQMSDAILEKTKLKITSDKYQEFFVSEGEVVKFDGFLKVYLEDKNNSIQNEILPKVEEKESLSLNEMIGTQKFTLPPSRYTEASLVKKMESMGIGRPSTYAPTISTIQNRFYITKGTLEGVEREYLQIHLKDEQIQKEKLKEKTGSNKGKLVPTDIGFVVNDFLTKNFETILDYNFTARAEEEFDEIARGDKDWMASLKEFYAIFNPIVNEVKKNAERESGERVLGNDPKTGKVIKVRLGKFGPLAQMGEQTDDEKPIYAGLDKDQSLLTITLEQALELFKFPKNIGEYNKKEVLINIGKFGPYIKYDNISISIPRTFSPYDITINDSIPLIEDKLKSLSPILEYKNLPVFKGVGRFGPYLKWNEKFINVNKKYDFDNLSEEDIAILIEEKIKKDKEKLIQHWEKEDIRIEKGRWGRFDIIKKKKKVTLPKETDIKSITLEKAKALLEKK